MHPTLTYDLVRLEQQHAAQRSQLARERARTTHPSDASRRPPSTQRPVAPVLRIATQRLV